MYTLNLDIDSSVSHTTTQEDVSQVLFYAIIPSAEVWMVEAEAHRVHQQRPGAAWAQKPWGREEEEEEEARKTMASWMFQPWHLAGGAPHNAPGQGDRPALVSSSV